MKKILVSLILGIMAFSTFAGQLTAFTSDAPVYKYVTGSSTRVTTTGTTAATFTNPLDGTVYFNLAPGSRYVLRAIDSVAAAADSIAYNVIGYGADGTTQMETVKIGSGYNGTGYGTYEIPLGVTLFGKFKIQIVKLSATVAASVKRWEIYAVAPSGPKK